MMRKAHEDFDKRNKKMPLNQEIKSGKSSQTIKGKQNKENLRESQTNKRVNKQDKKKLFDELDEVQD